MTVRRLHSRHAFLVGSVAFLAFVQSALCIAQTPLSTITPDKIVNLWPGVVPGAMGSSPADVPFLEVYLPAKNPTHTGVLICPGGGYHYLALDHEGANIADWLIEHHIAAFVLHYRVAPYRYPAPLLDGERAMRLVRGSAARYHLASDHIGVWGFSAGGHVASHLMVAFDAGLAPSAQTDAIDAVSDRPDFGVLSYPVISMRPAITHRGSHDYLLGANATTTQEDAQSNELHVRPDSPPAFLVAATDDPTVPVQNTLLFYQAYLVEHIPVEMHIFEYGGHGFALGERQPTVRLWPLLLASWMMQHGWIH